MKKIIVLLLILIVASCSEDSQTPTYTSLVGKWRFSTTTVPISGTFEIAEVAGALTIDNKFGEFKLNGTTYKIDDRNEMYIGGSFSQFWLGNKAVGAEVVFFGSEYSNDFKTITAKQFYYREGQIISTVYNETVVITRY